MSRLVATYYSQMSQTVIDYRVVIEHNDKRNQNYPCEFMLRETITDGVSTWEFDRDNGPQQCDYDFTGLTKDQLLEKLIPLCQQGTDKVVFEKKG